MTNETGHNRARIGWVVASVAALLLFAASGPVGAASPKAGNWGAKKFSYGTDLKFKVKGNKISKVSASVLEKCSTDSWSRTSTFLPEQKWKIARNGSFGGKKREKFDFGYGPIVVDYWFNGRFTSKTKAKGFLRMQTSKGASCDTLKLNWTAKRR